MATCTKFAFRTTSAFPAIGRARSCASRSRPERGDEARGMAALGRGGDRRALHPDPAGRPVAGRDRARLRGRRPGADRVPRPGRRGRAHTAAHVRDLRGFEQRTLVLERDAKGNWTVDGAKVRALKGATDVDLGCSPSTNTLPIRRLRLGVEASKTIKAAWVRFPELTVVKADQKYTRLDEFTYRYASGDFGRSSPSTTRASSPPTRIGRGQASPSARVIRSRWTPSADNTNEGAAWNHSGTRSSSSPEQARNRPCHRSGTARCRRTGCARRPTPGAPRRARG